METSENGISENEGIPKSSIPEKFFESSLRYAEKVAVVYKKEGVWFPVKYSELSGKIKNLAFVLQDVICVKKGSKIAVLSENRPEWLISDLAIMSVGAINVPLHTTLNSSAIFNILDHSEAEVLVVSKMQLLRKVFASNEKFRFLKKIIIFDRISPIEKLSLNFKVFEMESVLAQNKSPKYRKADIGCNDVCTIIYTSGTTGEPKAVVLTHKNILSNVEAINKAVPVKENDMFLSFLPLSHALERTAGQFTPMLFGAAIAYAENPKTLAQNLKEVKPTILISVPKIFEKFHDAIWDKINGSAKIKKRIFKWALKQNPGTLPYKIADFLVFKKIRSNLGGHLRIAISGGAKLNENLVKFFSKIGILILEGYGLTETSPVISVITQEDMASYGKIGVGRALPEVEIKISQEKEILVKGPNVFSGYYKNEKATKECFDKDGWFCTGDLGFVDKNNFLTVIGRKKEMLVLSGGKNVWPEPIENLLNNDRFISQSMVLGDNSNFISALICPDWQEVEKYLKENKLAMQSRQVLIKNQEILNIFQRRIEEKINPNLSDFEKIKNFVLLPEEFSQDHDELTPTLKLRRHIICRHYEKNINELK